VDVVPDVSPAVLLLALAAHPVAEVHHAAGEAELLDQLEVQADAGRARGIARTAGDR